MSRICSASREAARSALLALSLLSVIGVASEAWAGPGAWTSQGPEGGTVTAFAVDPSNPEVVYAATTEFFDFLGVATPGLFRSTDAGASWEFVGPIGAEAGGDAIRSLAVNPADSSMILAGSSRFLYKTLDQGGTWRAVGLINDRGGASIPGALSLIFAPGDSSTLLADASDGPYASLDVGETFSPQNLGLPDCNDSPSALAAELKTPGTFYISFCGIYKTTNFGASWQFAGTGLPVDDVEALASDPSTASTAYVVTSSHGIYRSTSGGANWIAIGDDGLPATLIETSLLVDPANPRHLDLAASGSVYESVDGGASWGLAAPAPSSFPFGPQVPLVAVGGVVLAGTQNGILRESGTPGSWVGSDEGLHAIAVAAVAQDPSDPTVAYAGTDSLGLFVSRDGGNSWSPIQGDHPLGSEGGGIGVVAVDPQNPLVLYLSVEDFSFPRIPTSMLLKSEDGGSTWAESDSGLKKNVIEQLVIDPIDSNVLFAVGGDGNLYRSSDGAATWIAAIPALSFAIDSADPSTAYAVSLSTSGVVIHRTSDSGSTWTDLPGPADTAGGSAMIGASGGRVYVAQSSATGDTRFVRVSVSPDRGQSWPGSGAAFSGLGPSAIVCLPAGSVAYVAASGLSGPGPEGGVFETRDGGANWTDISASLPDRDVAGLAVDAHGQFLHAATFTGVYDFELTRSPTRIVPVVPVKPAPIIGRDSGP